LTVYRHPARLIRHQLSLTCALLLGAGLLAPAASAQRDCQAPPGRAAIEQYCEVLPSAGGDRSAGDRRGGSGRDALPRSVRRQLDQAGAAGHAIAGLAGGSVGADEARGGRSRDGRTGEGAGGGVSSDGTASSGGVPGEPSDNPLEAVRSAAEAGPSSGSALLWALAAATVLLVALAWLRHRRRAEPQ
jgi:hypothetical protein